MAKPQYTKREQVLVGMLNYLWRQASHSYISPVDVQRVVTIGERLLKRLERKQELNQTNKGKP